MATYVAGRSSFYPFELLVRKKNSGSIFPLNEKKCFFYFSARYALAAGIKALGLRPGDAVLMPSLNCGTEIDPVVHLGVKVVFYRIGKNLLLDCDDLANRIAKDVKAVLVTHFLGFPQPVDQIKRICRGRGVFLIEDCAQALLSTHMGNPLGFYGDVSIFSLMKTLPVPNGGVLVINNKSIEHYQSARKPSFFSTWFYGAELLKDRTRGNNNALKENSLSLLYNGVYLSLCCARPLLAGFRNYFNPGGRYLVRPDSYLFIEDLCHWGISNLSRKIINNVGEQKMNKTSFDVNSTNACKGVALMLLLWHHLFYQHPEFGFVVYQTSQLAKVCVAIFLILSGYGFSESVKLKDVGLLQFYKHRLIAIYSNYWFIALIFVPVGVFFMGRTLQSAFTSHAYAKFIVQMTGLHRFAYGEYGYNETWWYMSVIISLILLFPSIHDAVKKYGLFVLLCFFAILIPGEPIVLVINEWLLPFAIGIYVSQRNYISAISRRLSAFGWRRYILLLVVTLLIAVFRTYSPLLMGTKIDWLFGLLIILFVFELSTTFHLIGKTLRILGGHLFNVFLFHTFIFYSFWKDFIYSFKQPILIFMVLLCLCITLSEIIEYLKRFIGFYSITQKLQSLRVPLSMEIPFQQDAPADARTSRG